MSAYRMTLDDGSLAYVKSACDRPEIMRTAITRWASVTGVHRVVKMEPCDIEEAMTAWDLPVVGIQKQTERGVRG